MNFRGFDTCGQSQASCLPLCPATATSGAENEANAEVPLQAGFKSEHILMDPHVKMPNFTAEMNMFTAWYNLVSIAPHSGQLTEGVFLYNSPI